MSAKPADFARLFEAQYAGYRDDLPLWRALSAESGGPILELGCGPGRVLIDLARRGHEVVGIDLDPSMLDRARLHLPPELQARIELRQADLREFDLGRTFALILVPCNTFAHLKDEEALSCLRAIRRHLGPGGSLALDLPHPAEGTRDAPEDGAEPVMELVEPETGNPLQIYAIERPSEDRGRVQVDWYYDELLPDGTVRRLEVPVVYHLRGPGVMEGMLKSAGFKEIEVYGDPYRGLLRPTSARMVIVARKG